MLKKKTKTKQPLRPTEEASLKRSTEEFSALIFFFRPVTAAANYWSSGVQILINSVERRFWLLDILLPARRVQSMKRTGFCVEKWNGFRVSRLAGDALNL